MLLVLAAQTLQCQHTTPRRRNEEAQQEMRERNGEFQAQRGTGRGAHTGMVTAAHRMSGDAPRSWGLPCLHHTSDPATISTP